MSTFFGTTASAVGATIDIITVSKFLLILRLSLSPSFGSSGSLVLVLLVFLVSELLLL